MAVCATFTPTILLDLTVDFIRVTANGYSFGRSSAVSIFFFRACRAHGNRQISVIIGEREQPFSRRLCVVYPVWFRGQLGFKRAVRKG